jgi:hypothetical protein
MAQRAQRPPLPTLLPPYSSLLLHPLCGVPPHRWRTFLGFLALKLCEGWFVACLVLARMNFKRPTNAGLRASGLVETTDGPMEVTVKDIITAGAGAATRMKLAGQLLCTEAATYIAALLEVSVVPILCPVHCLVMISDQVILVPHVFPCHDDGHPADNVTASGETLTCAQVSRSHVLALEHWCSTCASTLGTPWGGRSRACTSTFMQVAPMS